ncbi:hypothetical protein VB773_10950 [Haloarculaceae archaeon H-GB2-1]|nr:hypothetical protein [Haloarculaceae archaeon H-GB1-1]MEA5386510.1 hypothetical protein [Haloarculaceae archaeon H-GB11]MEA5408023.1 hypothetical protein [Haloarculaceae archaeon H-GB2-1]
MGVRPPSNDIDDGPDVVEFGIAALDAQLSEAEVSYPTTKRDLRDRLGHAEIPYDASGSAISFGDILDEVGQTEFETEQELLNAVHPVFERKREASSRSLLGQIRRLVPF